MVNTTELATLNEWLAQPDLDPSVRAELEDLKARNATDEIHDRFYRFMEFGTAGMRGIMGAGPNRINIHTIRKISQGYADHLNEVVTGKGRAAKVVIAYDNRRNSDLFAREAAQVFVANGIETFLFGKISATPLLSYAARELKTDGGVVITASHNNKTYNGYKIYDSHGCQCMPAEAARVAELIDAVNIWTDVKTPPSASHLHIIGDDMEQAYVNRVLAESLTPGAMANITAVYTPLNGAGSVPVQLMLKKAGIGELFVVKEQEHPDPDFTTAPEPNPEKTEALKLGLELCEKLKSEGKTPDVLIGTDPDADRLGAFVLHDGEYVRLNGNQVGILIFDYIISCREASGTMPEKPVFITTIVSTPITLEMAKKHGIEAHKVLTGFKNIGDQINKLEANGEEDRYIFGFEESCGYCSGTYCRDKDAQNAALLLLEAAGVQKQKGGTLVGRLHELYKEYGYYLDGLDELVRPGEKGMHEIQEIMTKLREPDTQKAFSAGVRGFTDYMMAEGDMKSDVVEFDLNDGCRILARPSGTEPKLKIYYTGVGPTEQAAEQSIAKMKQEVGAATCRPPE